MKKETGITKEQYRMMAEQLHGIFNKEIQDAVDRTFIGQEFPIAKTEFEETRTTKRRGGYRYEIVDRSVTRIIGNIVEFEGGLSCTTKELAAFYRNPRNSVIGLCFR